VISRLGGANLRRDRPDLSVLTVLVVDDHAESRELLRELLESHGARVLEAEDVRAAEGMVSTPKVDLIITDLAMPGRDGAAFLKWLREQPRDKGGTLPAIAVTAYDKRYPATDLSGWAAYFRKPLDVDELVRTIAAILTRPTEKE